LKKDEKARVFSYGDTVMDIDLSKLIKIHKKNRNLVTATSYLAKYEYGLFEINDEIIINFYEKQFPKFFRINSGFFVVDRNSVSLFSRNAKNLDGYFLKKIIDKNKLGNYSHEGIWFPIDTIQQVKEYEKFIRANERTLYNDNL
jgi:glucose-1-phosphate cytidylyltransferase